jgi:DTW domain-containing protein YfiP
MVKKLPWLSEMRHVCLPPGGAPSMYRLRSGRNVDDLATAEAIARAMDVLEGPEVKHAIERIFRIMIERTLFSRGLLGPESVHGGIPEGVKAHDPRPVEH